MDIRTVIGETSEYDKKLLVEKRKVKNWLKSVSAFSNGIGGILIFGISDTDEVVGLEDVKSDSEFISQKIKERIDPFPKIKMLIHTVDGKNLIFLEVYKGYDTPYYYIGDGMMETYIRIGNESIVADVTELKRLVLNGKSSSYDSLISDSKLDDYSFTKLKERYKIWTGNRMEDKIFFSFGLINECDQLTNAGLLIADDGNVYNSRLFCTRWNGLNKAGGIIDALDSGEYSGSLIALLNDGIAFVKRNTKVMWKKVSDSRIEFPDYVDRSVFESVVNALIHRDYLIFGSEVHIDIYDDRMTLYSPGGMPDGRVIQETNIRDVPSTRRNPLSFIV